MDEGVLARQTERVFSTTSGSIPTILPAAQGL
jgi:hypothetical protein